MCVQNALLPGVFNGEERFLAVGGCQSHGLLGTTQRQLLQFVQIFDFSLMVSSRQASVTFFKTSGLAMPA